MDANKLAKKLRNIGRTVAQKLIDAGLDTPDKLRRVGAKEAYLRIHESGGFRGRYYASYLYALEGAILDCDWRDIPESTKQAHKQFTATLRAVSV